MLKQLCQGEAVNSNTFYGRPFREPRRGRNSDNLRQSGASESAAVCFVISLSICYWLLHVCACVYVWEERERERRERERERAREKRERERERERERKRERERERETGSHHSGVYSASEIVISACLQIHTSIITVSVMQLCSPLDSIYINMLSYFEGTANLHCYTSCTLTTLHCSKVSFLQCCHMNRYNKIFTKNVRGVLTSVRYCIYINTHI